jgi:hypothetical protein
MSLDPGGSGNPLPRSHLTLALSGPSSRHWKTTSRPMLKKEIRQQQFHNLTNSDNQKETFKSSHTT